jgi:transposase
VPHGSRQPAGHPPPGVALTSDQALALRCRIVLACAEGASNAEVAARLGISRPTVTKWRSRFVARRLEGLADEPRPGAARTITDEQVEQVLVATLETTPADATHWSTRSLARQLGMSQSAISRIWRALGSSRTWSTPSSCPPTPVIEKVRDVVGMYLYRPQAAMVPCVDENTGVRALDRTPPRILPCCQGPRSGPPTTTPAMAPPTCTPPWKWPAARSSRS